MGGVAAGLGDYLGIEPNLVRLAFVVLTLAGGLGVVLYLVAFTLMPAANAPELTRPAEPDVAQTAAFGVVVIGLLLVARTAGAWFSDAVVWPLTIAAFGLALLWMRSPHEDEQKLDWPALDRLPPAASDALSVVVGSRGGLIRAIGGGVLVIGGIALFLVSVGSWEALRGGVLAGVVVAAGIALALGPGLVRMGRELADERRERIRSEERADMAAHLHDSVLQTLALVQRRADDPREVVRLARRQERELRAWLLSGETLHDDLPPATLGAALDAAAAEIEDLCGVPVDIVRVRDCPLTGLEPLVSASREAMLNAARHSGAPSISVYAEVEPERATVFVRDRGRGFDPDTVPADRGGIAASIVGRITRRGGQATIRSTAGEGTEVELVLPRIREQEPA